MQCIDADEELQPRVAEGCVSTQTDFKIVDMFVILSGDLMLLNALVVK
jgi:hypothetical protein